jgi:hypothetical protein
MAQKATRGGALIAQLVLASGNRATLGGRSGGAGRPSMARTNSTRATIGVGFSLSQSRACCGGIVLLQLSKHSTRCFRTATRN